MANVRSLRDVFARSWIAKQIRLVFDQYSGVTTASYEE